MLNWLKKKRSMVLQFETKDCGPAALLTILRFYGGQASLSYIRELCQTTPSGTSMYDLLKASERIGFQATGLISNLEQLSNLKMPCIAHLILPEGITHFVVIFKAHSNSIEIGDPAQGVSKYNVEHFKKLWISRAILLLNPSDKLYSSPQNSWFKWLLFFVFRERSLIYQTLFLGLIYTIVGLLTAFFIQLLIDRLVPEFDTDKILITAIFLFVLFMFRALAGYLRSRFLVKFYERIGLHLNMRFIMHVFQMPLRFFEQRCKGDITARYHDVIRIQNAMVKLVGLSIIDGLVIIASLLYMYLLSVELTLIMILCLPVLLFSTSIYIKRIQFNQQNIMRSNALFESSFIEALNGIKDILNMFSERNFAKRIQKKSFHVLKYISTVGELQARLMFLSDISGSIITLILLTYSSLLVIEGLISFGKMMAAYALIGQIMPATLRLIDVSVNWQELTIATRRLLEIMTQKSYRMKNGIHFPEIHSIELKNGCFHFNRRSSILKNISIQLIKGHITVLCGPSGAGKTTIVQVLLRNYALSCGTLRINNLDASRISLFEYRKNVCLVPQNTFVFNGTLMDNILIGRYTPSEELLRRYIEYYDLSELLCRFRNGLNTHLGEEGQRISGGEQQVIGLCRALLTYPQVLIIDEAFNSMDSTLLNQIFHIIRKYRDHCAILLITHNKDMIMQCDYLYQIDRGQVIEQGHPRDLFADLRK